MKKERWHYSPEEIALLRRLCRAEPPMLWKDIAAHFPGRSVPALLDKAKQLGLKNGRRGRPLKNPGEPRQQVDREDRDWAAKAGKASEQLGRAIEALFERQGWRIAA